MSEFQGVQIKDEIGLFPIIRSGLSLVERKL
jgi:hypothetical protein